MRSVKYLISAGAASLLPTMAIAADMPIMPPPPAAYAPPPQDPCCNFGGWYLRGDVGFSNQSVNHVLDTNPAAYDNVNVSQTSSFGSAGIFDVGAGYQFNSWFRGDVTAQWRGKSNFTGLDVVTGTGPLAGFVGTDSYAATKSELVFLANAYVDLGTWWCVTPFIGAGIGTARVSIGDFSDTGFFHIPPFPSAPVTSYNYGGSASQWNFAWAAHAGLAYKVSPSLTIELAYTYIDMGSGLTGATSSFDQVTNTTHAPFKFNDITSHDVTLGVRWNFDTPQAPVQYQMPLVRKG
ncbi:MAG: porin family protein [Bradyrhizobium sp.]|nr:porin family protein [Bradyrhizobium sp.]